MTTKLIIIDGMDNTGKSTLIKRLTNVLKELNNTIYTIHLQKPPKDIKQQDVSKYQHDYYNALIQELIELKAEKKYNYIILDRGWISEYVYGPIYRNRNKQEICEDNIVLDLKVNSIFRDLFITKSDVYLFVLTASTDFLLNHEDGLSLSNKDESLINIERDTFIAGFDLSLIDKKQLYNIGNNNEFVEILPNICKIIIS